MAQNKKDEFQDTMIGLSVFAKALSHPARIAILSELARQNTCICGDIVEVLPLAQSTVSQHLKELKTAGLIKGSIEGNRSCYCIDTEVFQDMTEQLQEFCEYISKEVEDPCC